MMGKAPLAAKERAIARPTPEEEPVMIVTREDRRVERRGVAIFERGGLEAQSGQGGEDEPHGYSWRTSYG